MSNAFHSPQAFAANLNAIVDGFLSKGEAHEAVAEHAAAGVMVSISNVNFPAMVVAQVLRTLADRVEEENGLQIHRVVG